MIHKTFSRAGERVLSAFTSKGRSRHRAALAAAVRGSRGLEWLECRTLLSTTYDLVSINLSKDAAAGAVGQATPAVSANGRYIAFVSTSQNLVLGDTGSTSYSNIVVYDSVTHTTQRASFTWDGSAPNGSSSNPSISADGRYVVYQSQAGNLTLGQQTTSTQVFMADLQTHATYFVSRGINFTMPDGMSVDPVINANGTVVVFHSTASNLVAGFSGNTVDTLYRYNVATHSIAGNLTTPTNSLLRVSGFLSVDALSISGDGRYVVFSGQYLSYSGGSGAQDAFLIDLTTNAITDISANVTPGVSAQSKTPSISADGETVVYDQFIIDASSNLYYTLYSYDTITHETRKITTTTDGKIPNGFAELYPVLSGDGRFVTFESDSTNIPSSPGGLGTNIFVYDRLLGTQQMISPKLEGAFIGGGTTPVINSDGTIVAFTTSGNFSPVDTGVNADVYATHLDVVPMTDKPPTVFGQNFNLLEHSSAGTAVGTVQSSDPDGDQLTLTIIDGNSSNGFSIDSNTGILRVATPGVLDYLTHPDFTLTIQVTDPTGLKDVDTVTVHLIKAPVSSPNTIQRISVSTAGVQANAQSYDNQTGPSVSADGRYTVFVSTATNLIDGVTTNAGDVYVYDRTNKSVELISMGDGRVGSDGGLAPSISGDGRYVAFVYGLHIKVFDRQNRTTELVPVDPEGPAISGQLSEHPFISADGRYVTYEYHATLSLIPSVTRTDVIVYDRANHTSEVVSIGPSGALGSALSMLPSISGDGRYVAFQSTASNLVPGDTNATKGIGGLYQGQDIFVYDRQTQTTVRASVSSSNNEADNYSLQPMISANGQFVVFESWASTLIAGGNTGTSIYVRDLVHNTTTDVSRPAGLKSDGASYPVISADGMTVAFSSFMPGIVKADVGGGVYVLNRATHTFKRADKPASGVANSFTQYPALSGDGSYVAFYSNASNLVNGDTNNVIDAFLAPLGNGAGATPLPDLTGSFNSLKLGKATISQFDIVTPGDKVSVSLSVTNQGLGAAKGPITVDFYASTSGVFNKNTAVLIGSGTRAGTLNGGANASVNAMVTIPSTLTPGGIFLFADIDPDNKILESDETNNDPISPSITLAFWTGSWGNHNNAPVTLTDASGTVGTLQLSGGGVGVITPTEDGFDVTIDGSTDKATFTLTVMKGTGDGTFALHNITVNNTEPGVVPFAKSGVPTPINTVKSINLPNGILTGTLQAPAGITSITLLATDDYAHVAIGSGPGSAVPVAITIGVIHNLTIDSAAPLKSITATEWTHDQDKASSIHAPSLATLTIKGDKRTGKAGDFSADVVLTDTSGKSALGTVSIAGAVINAAFIIAGNVGTFTAGAFRQSVLAAGFTGERADLPTGLPATLPTVASIGTVTIKDLAGSGNGYVASQIYARTIGVITLRDVLTVDASGQPGVETTKMTKFTRQDAAGKTVKKLTKLSTPLADADDDTPDDFIVRIVAT